MLMFNVMRGVKWCGTLLTVMVGRNHVGGNRREWTSATRRSGAV